ncbi:MAG TPA: carboxylate-amine ligase [Ktedonobacteraceae bacterium]|nr:carboxylate-amine ligase [Ktedonobacteraceae bacterium]
MPSQFTLGVEQEFQMVDGQTGQLYPHILTVLEKGAPIFGEKIKPEMLQSAVEIVTGICPDIPTLRLELRDLQQKLSNLLEEDGIRLISAGTHPEALWQDQPSMPNRRYIELEEELQDIARSILIFALHVHVGVKNHEMAVLIMNQARSWIPHFLALSANSPFWAGRFTGIKSYRSVVWRPFPRSGVSDVFPSWSDFDNYVQALIKTGCIDNGKKIWWDIRPHPFFNTVEFRICDMPASFEDSIALAALCQALVAKLDWLHRHGMTGHILPRALIDENKWRAMRYGLDGEILDFTRDRRLTMRESISELLDFVDEVVDDLGSRSEINYLRALLADKRGTGADRQIEVYRRTGSIQAVTQYLMQQTLQMYQPS